MAKQKLKSVEGRIFKNGEPMFYLTEHDPRGYCVSTYNDKVTYTQGLSFYREENAKMFLIGRNAIEVHINKGYEYHEGNDEGIGNSWENKPYLSLSGNPVRDYDATEIRKEILREAVEKCKGIE